MAIRLQKSILNILNKKFANSIFVTGVRAGLNRRKKVDKSKDSLISTPRGLANKKKNMSAGTTNTKILEYLYEDNFKFYELSFTNQNPNLPNFINSIKFLLDEKPTRFENAVTANVKAFLDYQNRKKNAKSTIKQKKFDGFGLDSRQFQSALGTELVLKK